jgi:hypothetical protein
MKKASEYRRHAEECRALAKGVQGEQKVQLLEMAATWDNLAAERTEFIKRHPELALPDEGAEEAERAKRLPSNG